MSKEQDEFPWNWSDELVKEFYKKWHGNIHFNQVINDLLPKAIEEFKISKQPKSIEWEIECIQINNENYWKQPSGSYKSKLVDTGSSAEFLLASRGKIIQVKRLADGEVFSVGDEVVNQKSRIGGQMQFKIGHFHLHSGNIISAYDFDPAFGINFLSLSHASKPVREVLFTSFDGVKIFPGDDFFITDLSNGNLTSITAGEKDRGYWKHAKLFSTKEKAEEYILINKPIFSLKDIMGIWSTGRSYVGVDWLIEKLTMQAKEKIKG